MARTNTTTAPAITKEDLVAQILAGSPSSSSGLTIGQRVAAFAGNRIADTGDSLAEVAAGFSAAGRNYSVAKQAAELRQAERTAERILSSGLARYFQQ